MIIMKSLKIVLVDTNPLLIHAWKTQLKSLNKYCELKFSSSIDIDIHHGYLSSLPIETKKRTAIVSPANSIGGMGGGFDEALCELFSPTGYNNYSDNDNDQINKIHNPVESWIRKFLHHGYTPLGTAHVIEFFNFPQFKSSKAWKNLHANSIVVLPTMRVPRSIYSIKETDSQDLINIKNQNVIRFIFDCIWESLCAVNRHNERIIQIKTKNSINNTIDLDDDIQGSINTLVIPGLGTGYGNLPIALVAKGMIGALSIWGLNLETNSTQSTIDRGVLCLSFLGEDYRLFNNPDIMNSANIMFGDFNNSNEYEKFNILNNDVGDFYKLIIQKN